MKYILLVLLLFIDGVVSQTPEEDAERKRILEQYGSKKQYNDAINKENNPEESTNDSSDIHQEIEQKTQIIKNIMNEDSDTDIAEINAHRKQLEALTQSIMQKRGMSEDGELNKSVFTNMMDDKMKAGLAKMIKSSPFSNTSKEDIRSQFVARTEGTFLEKLFKKYPKALDIFTEIFHDKEAVPSFLSIVNKPKKMKYFSAFVITVFVCVFLLNLMNSKSNFFKRLLLKFGLMLGGATVNFLGFYFIFNDEIGPIVEIILRSL